MKSGYVGKDSLRANAERLFKDTLFPTGKTTHPELKGGGKVHKLTRDQSDLHLPVRSNTRTRGDSDLHLPSVKRSSNIESMSQAKKMGYADGGMAPRSKAARPMVQRKANGGIISGLEDAAMAIPSMFKSGGKVQRKAIGGGILGTALGGYAGEKAGNFIGNKFGSPETANLLSRIGSGVGGFLGGVGGGAIPFFKKGGKVSRKGSMAEREMVGEKPSRKAPHFNYEAQMDGEKRRKFAAGGVAKIRHDQSTSRGAPITSRPARATQRGHSC